MKVKIEKVDNPSQLNIESVEIHNDIILALNFTPMVDTFMKYVSRIIIKKIKQKMSY